MTTATATPDPVREDLEQLQQPAPPAQLPAVRDDVDVITPEVVAEIPEPRAQPIAIVGLPSFEELQAMEYAARQIAATDLVPRAYRNKPDAIVACWLAGRELRIPPMQSLRDIDIVEGKPAPSAKLMRELILRNGHQMRRKTAMDDATKATIAYRRRDWPEGEWLEATWTIEQAVDAGLVQLKDGKPWARGNNGGKLPWETYTAAMLRHRCLSAFAREDFADCLGSMIYLAEELGAMVDADGRVVDSPATDPRTPYQVRWENALEELPEVTRDYALEKLNAGAQGKPFARLDVKTQETWTTWLEGILDKYRAKLRAEAAGGADPDQPHAFRADQLGACAVCGGNAGGDLHPDDGDAGAPADGSQPGLPPGDSSVAMGEPVEESAGVAPAAAEGPQATAGRADPPDAMPAPSRMRRFHALRREVGWPEETYRDWLRSSFAVSSSKDLEAAQLEEAIRLLEEVLAQEPAASEGPQGEPEQAAAARSTAGAEAKTSSPGPEPQTAPERVSPGQPAQAVDEAQIREDLEARYAVAYERCLGDARRKGVLDGKRVLALPGGASDWQTVELDVVRQLVAHAEKLATEIDPSRPLPAMDGGPY